MERDWWNWAHCPNMVTAIDTPILPPRLRATLIRVRGLIGLFRQQITVRRGRKHHMSRGLGGPLEMQIGAKWPTLRSPNRERLCPCRATYRWRMEPLLHKYLIEIWYLTWILFWRRVPIYILITYFLTAATR